MVMNNRTRSRFPRCRFRAKSLLAPALIGAALVAAPVSAATRNCTAREQKDGDKWLWLSPADKQLSMETQLPWGAPPEPDEAVNPLLIQRDYVVRYSTTLLVPIW